MISSLGLSLNHMRSYIISNTVRTRVVMVAHRHRHECLQSLSKAHVIGKDAVRSYTPGGTGRG